MLHAAFGSVLGQEHVNPFAYYSAQTLGCNIQGDPSGWLKPLLDPGLGSSNSW